MFSLVGTVLAIIYQHDAFYSWFFMDEELPMSSENGLNSKIYLFDGIIMLVMSLLIFKHGKSLFKVSASGFLKSLMITIGVFVIFKFVIVAGMFAMKLSTLSAAFDIVQLTITDIYANYGALATFVTIAFLTPLIEEYLFRGVLLNSFTKHVSFAWANTLQAGVFSLIHESHYIHHFIFGLIVGYLVKTQKHLYGAIFFHVLNNALAVSVMVL
jgi:membrane protease YdiL (CAAX protease family)